MKFYRLFNGQDNRNPKLRNCSLDLINHIEGYGCVNSVLKMKKLLLILSAALLCVSSSGFAEEKNKSNEILLGMSTALSGPAEELGRNMLDGINAGFYRVNQQGGINQKLIKVLVFDDGYEPQRTAPNMHHLLEDKSVLAIIGNVGTSTAITAIPITTKNKTLFFAPYTGADVLRKTPPDRYVINYRASYAQEISAMVDALINHAGFTPDDIAFFTQKDSYGDAGFRGGITALKHHGLKDEYSILHTRYERNTLAVENAVADILLKKKTLRAIIMVGAYAPSAKFIKILKGLGINPLFLNVSFVGSEPLAKHLGNNTANVIVTQVVPSPENISLKIVRDFQQDMNAFNPKAELSFGALEGYISSRVLVMALQSLKDKPDRENIIDAIEGLGDFDIGLGIPLKLNNHRNQASDMVWPTILNSGKFTSFLWSDLKRFSRDD